MARMEMPFDLKTSGRIFQVSALVSPRVNESTKMTRVYFLHPRTFMASQYENHEVI